jgi:hypothetical protein
LDPYGELSEVCFEEAACPAALRTLITMGSTSARTELAKRVAAAAAVENVPNFMLMAIHKVSAVVEEVVGLALLIEEQNVRPR